MIQTTKINADIKTISDVANIYADIEEITTDKIFKYWDIYQGYYN